MNPGAGTMGGFSLQAGGVSLLKSPRVLLAGWIHCLAFDLMVGLFIVIDAVRIGTVLWWPLPAVFLTLMFGPVGLLLYAAMRSAMSAVGLSITCN